MPSFASQINIPRQITQDASLKRADLFINYKPIDFKPTDEN
jgi:hypothetical protein